MAKYPRILLYSHDTFGLGHLRRNLAIAHQIARDIPDAHQLLLTGSMVAGAFALPPKLDMIKLPALSKRSDGRYKSRALPLNLTQTIAWREQMILQAAINFAPDIFLVDKVAAGAQQELLPTLRYLKSWSPRTNIVLGMRDIEDAPAITIREWNANNVSDLLNDVYDRILLYGQRSIFDPVDKYEMSPNTADKLIECGYLRRTPEMRPKAEVRRELGLDDEPLVLVTVGGGGDGHEVISRYLKMLAAIPELPFHTVLVTGPLMAPAKRLQIEAAAAQENVTLLEFTPDLTSYMNAADLVISMAGYNTVCELLSLQKRAILIPRNKVREEQLIRATCLKALGLVETLKLNEMSSHRLASLINLSLAKPAPTSHLNLNGLGNITQELSNLLENLEPVTDYGHSEAISVSLTLAPTNQKGSRVLRL